MNIAVCVKRIPKTAEADLFIEKDGSDIKKDHLVFTLNDWDGYAVREAVRLKEEYGSGTVTVLTTGPEESKEVLTRCLAMGADKGIHICDPALDGADAYVTASALAAALKGLAFDMIFCGQRAVDDDAGQVGAILAELLGIPQITMVTKLEVSGTSAKAVKPIEGAQLVIESPLPCVITAQKGLNEPRYASLPGIMKAKKKPVDVKNAQALGISTEAKVKILKFVPPPARPPGKIIAGDDAAAKAAQLAKLLKEEAKLI